MTDDWVIRKAGYFYRPNRAGYTSDIREAGRYSEVEAKREAEIEPWHMSAHLASEFEPQPHKVMTPEEYAATPLKGWHEVCRDVDGAGGVGIRYLG